MRGYIIQKKLEKEIIKVRMYDHFEFFDKMKKNFYDRNANIVIRCCRRYIKSKKDEKKREMA